MKYELARRMHAELTNQADTVDPPDEYVRAASEVIRWFSGQLEDQADRTQGTRESGETPTIVVVTGGRDYNSRARVFEELDWLGPWLVIQGGATGADGLAALWAYERARWCLHCPADWEKHGKRAGPKRNAEMMATAARFHSNLGGRLVCLAFPGGKGTAHAVSCVPTHGGPEMELLEVEP